MFNRVQRKRIAIVSLLSLSLNPLCSIEGREGGPSGGGFRGGARGREPGPSAGRTAPHPGASPSAVSHGEVGIHGGSPGIHDRGFGANHVGGVGHGGPGGFHQEMMHSAGPHWNNYHQAYFGNHSIHLAYAGYHPSYFYHPWYHGPWGGHAWGWGWGFGPGMMFGLAGVGVGIGIGASWGYPVYYGPYGRYGYWGRPLGWGFGGWGLGTTVYSSGYYPYYNPYYANAGYPMAVYDYSRPIPVAIQAPPANSPFVASNPSNPNPPPLDNPAFDAARAAFTRGDYPTALANVDAAIRKTPTDSVMHEFRSLTLFAMRDYRQSAAVIHSVLAVGPGWDYTTMSSQYSDPAIYSDQLARLEEYAREHPRAVDAHFLLAYHDMIGSHREAASAELQQVIRLMPNDRLAGELLAMVKGPPKQAPLNGSKDSTFDGTSDPLHGGPSPANPNSVPSVVAAAEPPPVDKMLLPGGWNASRSDGSKFRLTLTDDGRFTWKFSTPNQKGEEFSGNYTVDGPVLLLERKEGGALAGTATFDGDTKMNFKMVGAPPEDQGLDFARS